tara:strand:+ start:38 stop:883 length:846 start_codon:yes stop_codon:yes gene_type:complete
MFKKIFKAAKDLVKSPIGQIGIGLLAPQLAGASGILGGIGKFAAASPALFQGGISLLGGDKPENVLRNLAIGAGLSGLQNVANDGTFMGGISNFTGMGEGKTGTIADFFKSKEKPTLAEFAKDKFDIDDIANSPNFEAVLDEYNKIPTASTFTNILNSPITPYAAQFGVTAALAKMAADQAQDARAFYNPDENPFLAAKGGGIRGFAMGTPKFPRMTGDISGPGTGTSDSIPAMLSDGEHVLTKQEVSQIGGGDNDLGHQRLYAAREGLRKQARANGIGRI